VRNFHSRLLPISLCEWQTALKVYAQRGALCASERSAIGCRSPRRSFGMGGDCRLDLERRRRCAAELELRQRLMQVVHLNRSAIAGALSASVAHELNQPLATIQNTAEAAILYLKAGPPNTTRIEHLLGNIIRDDNRAAKKIGAICADC